jgi:hypothetical protein
MCLRRWIDRGSRSSERLRNFANAPNGRRCSPVSAIPITEKLLLNAGGWQAYPDVAVAPAKALMVDLPHASIHRD